MVFIKKILPLIFFTLLGTTRVMAQEIKDSVVQLYGIVMTADSLRGLDGVSVSVKEKAVEQSPTIRVYLVLQCSRVM